MSTVNIIIITVILVVILALVIWLSLITSGENQLDSTTTTDTRNFKERDRNINKRNLDSREISFHNISDHNLNKSSFYDIGYDLYTNFFYSLTNKARELISGTPLSIPQVERVTSQDTKPRIECLFPKIGSDFHNVVTHDLFARNKDLKRNRFNDGVNSQDEITCSRGGNKQEWKYDSRLGENRCMCKPGYSGCCCEYENHHDNYVAIGDKENENLLDIVAGENCQTDTISFTQGEEVSCSQLCDKDTECAGFYIEESKIPGNKKYECMLLKSNVVPILNFGRSENLVFTPEIRSSFFLKSKEEDVVRPRYKDRVIVGDGRRVLRPWMNNSYQDEFSRVDHIFPNEVHYLNYIPTYMINDTGPEEDINQDYGQFKYVVMSQLPLNEALIDSKSFNDSETMRVLGDQFKGLTELNIPLIWEEVYIYVYVP